MPSACRVHNHVNASPGAAAEIVLAATRCTHKPALRSQSRVHKRPHDVPCNLRLILILTILTSSSMAETLTPATAQRFADLALACIHREYPTKIGHVLNSDQDVKRARDLTPAFYGCYDWHSSVHGHWLLARLARTFPDAPFTSRVKSALGKSLTAGNLQREADYLKGEGRASFERPYGLAWLLQLVAELREWNDPDAAKWSTNA